MNALQDLEDLGLRVGWRTALVGWDGPAANERQVDGRQIVELAVRKLDQTSAMSSDALQLASLTGDELERIDYLLRRLASREHTSDDLELRKWRFLLLTRLLDRLPEDPLYAWITLAEFWHSFAFPKDCPAIVRSFENLHDAERYTAQARARLLAEHEQWLANERAHFQT